MFTAFIFVFVNDNNALIDTVCTKLYNDSVLILRIQFLHFRRYEIGNAENRLSILVPSRYLFLLIWFFWPVIYVPLFCLKSLTYYCLLLQTIYFSWQLLKYTRDYCILMWTTRCLFVLVIACLRCAKITIFCDWFNNFQCILIFA